MNGGAARAASVIGRPSPFSLLRVLCGHSRERPADPCDEGLGGGGPFGGRVTWGYLSSEGSLPFFVRINSITNRSRPPSPTAY